MKRYSKDLLSSQINIIIFLSSYDFVSQNRAKKSRFITFFLILLHPFILLRDEYFLKM